MNPRTSALEWELLRALCSGALEVGPRREVLAALANYHFTGPIHQALFDELGRLEPERAELLRQELPPRLTRRGFPEVDFDALFTPSSLTAEQALEKMRHLLQRPEPV